MRLKKLLFQAVSLQNVASVLLIANGNAACGSLKARKEPLQVQGGKVRRYLVMGTAWHPEGSVHRGVCETVQRNNSTVETEDQLVQYIFKWEEDMFALSVTDVRMLTFGTADSKKLKNRFN
jgi:hypothetical protein